MKINAILIVFLSSVLFSCQQDNWPEDFSPDKGIVEGSIKFLNESNTEGYTIPGGTILKESYEPVTLTLIGTNKRIVRQTVSIPDPTNPYLASFRFEDVPVGSYVISGESENYKCWGTDEFQRDSSGTPLVYVPVYQKDFRNIIDSVISTPYNGSGTDFEIRFAHAQNQATLLAVVYASEKPDVSHDNFREKFVFPFSPQFPGSLSGRVYVENHQDYFGDSIYFNMYLTSANPNQEFRNQQEKVFFAPFARRTYRFSIYNPW